MLPRSLLSRLVSLALLGGLAGCGGGDGGSPDPNPDAATRERTVVPPTEDLSTLDQLAQIGYVEYGRPDAETRSGVVRNEDGAWPGYTLVTSLSNGRAQLIDMQGNELRSWADPVDGAEARWSRAEILADGDLLCLANKSDVLYRMSFDGHVRWSLPLEIHHDGIELPDGRLLVLTRKFRDIPAIDATHRSVDNFLAFVSGDGELLEERSLYDLLLAEPRALEVTRPPGLEKLPAGYNIDPMHANTVFWLARPELEAGNPLFRPGRVLVTFRYLDSVALFDLAEGRCVWAWGKGELEGPHDASVLPSGHVLVLDNGSDRRGYSRVLEMDPLTGQVLWEYRAPEPEDFHTSGRGTVQALPNGDVLVGNSNSGEAFEVTREGRIVWRFLNPFRDEKGARGVIRVERYAPEFVEPLLAGSVGAEGSSGR